MDILKRIEDYAHQSPSQTVMISGSRQLTWGQLWEYSNRLACWLQKEEQTKEPIAVYGHKHPWMLVCFLACVKSGRAYCPIDISVPDERVKMILEELPSQVVLTTEALFADDEASAAAAEGERTFRQSGSGESTELTGEWTGRCGECGEYKGKRIVPFQDLKFIVADESLKSPSWEEWVSGEDIWYIIFTSGSMGTPKGVQITADCLNHYLDWSVGLGTSQEQKRGQVFLNQAPFSFDLSVMDLYTCLASGGTLYCLEKQVQADYAQLFGALGASGANVWVSTPSFADVCLSDKKFNRELLPGLEVFLFCGETLGCRTAKKLQERFPEALVINTYGPTESTVAVTDVLVTPELAAADTPLPVGKAKPGTQIEIRDAQGNCVPDGEKGEIIIIGDTVSPGYYHQEALTEKAFFKVTDVAYSNEIAAVEAAGNVCKTAMGEKPQKVTGADESENAQKTTVSGTLQEVTGVCESENDQKPILRETLHKVTAAEEGMQKYLRAYRTGDEGYLLNGMLYYSGRIDLQIKLHGYRIELEDIENNIRRLPEIEHVVVVPNQRGGKVSSLTAYVVLGSTEAENDVMKNAAETVPDTTEDTEKAASGMTGSAEDEADGKSRITAGMIPADEKAASAHLRERLASFLPSYMIPKKFVFLEQMPMTNNGKADRKLLGGRNA